MNIDKEDISKKYHTLLISGVVEQSGYLVNDMDDEWNQDLPGSCHSEPDNDYYQELLTIKETEEA